MPDHVDRESASRSKGSRRAFVDRLLSLGVVGSMASVICPVVRYLSPLAKPGRPGRRA